MKHVPDTEPELVCHESWIVCAKWHEETRMVHPFLVCVFAFDPRQEPSAVVPLAGICAGGRPQGRSLPRPHTGAKRNRALSISRRHTDSGKTPKTRPASMRHLMARSESVVVRYVILTLFRSGAFSSCPDRTAR